MPCTSASDILGSLIVMIGAAFPTRRPTPATPTGTKSSSASRPSCWANILVLVGAAIGYAGVMKIVRGETLAAPGVLALIAAVVSIGVKEGLYWVHDRGGQTHPLRVAQGRGVAPPV